ncbi:tetratricopeptide repeat protein [Fluviicola sp.]|jgi:tetratricopeptide (TPR) repeat protein|uniref:tetratricopeptide repeat protein n=1 Tax=Fluviicola sp. TaxID=1917219 RepID=UPI00282D841C|nr:tetratricopeptide repeat protein [Fluviicola sp.]MDR0803342.1 tetratricopeptide repeat protein [Fluviicola sp.]
MADTKRQLIFKKITPQEYFIKAFSYYIDGDFNAAIELYNQYIELDIEDHVRSGAFSRRGDAKAKLHMYDDAIQDYSKSIDLLADNPSAYSNRGVIKMKLRLYEEAIEDFNKAIELQKNFGIAYYNRATAKVELKKYNELIEDYNKAIEFDPQCAIFYNGRGNANCNLEKYDVAIEDYTIAIEKEPHFISAYNNRGNAKFKLNKVEEANQDFKIALTLLNPNLEQKFQWQHVVSCAYPKFVEDAESYVIANNIDKGSANSLLLKILSLMKLAREDYEDIVKKLILHSAYFSQITEADQNNRQQYENIYLQILKIISQLHLDEMVLPISHYTRTCTTESLLFDNSPLWLSDLSNTNDEHEGDLLFKYLNIDKKYSSNKLNAFVSCFVLGNDNPNMFRLYGKTNKEENSGLCLTIKADYFNQQLTLIDTEITDNKIKTSLFSCIYIFYNQNDPDDTMYVTSVGGGNENKKIEIQNNLNFLKKLVDNKCLNKYVICDLLTALRFLIKIDSWQDEKECRIVKVAFSDNLNIVNNKENRGNHINYMPINQYVDKIHIGCNAFKNEIKRKEFIEKIKQNNLPIQCILSRHKNRKFK